MTKQSELNLLRTGDLTEMVLHKYGCAKNEYVGGQKYIGMTQVRSAAGHDVQTGDVVVMGAWESTTHLIEGFEVKISRADWLNELRKEGKNSEIIKHCHKFWLVISDEKMVKEGELPDNWGMMIPKGNGLKVVTKANLVEPEPVTHSFMAMMLRSNQSPSVPLDVHKDQVKDAKRVVEAEYKLRYKKLNEYVKYLNAEMGINISENYGKEWKAAIKRRWSLNYDTSNLTPLQLVDLFKSCLQASPVDVKRELEEARNASIQLKNISDKYLKEFKDET